MSIHRKTITALAAVSVLAAGVAPSGASAATKIDGKNVKQKTLSGKSLRDRTVTRGKLALGVVDASRLAALAVGPNALAANAVSSPKIADGSILFQDLDVSVQNMMKSGGVLPGSIVTDHLADNSVTAPKIAPDAVGDEELAPNSVNSDEVQDNTLTADDLAPNSVTQSEIATDGVSSAEVQNGTLNAVDVGMRRGASAENFAPVPANGCSSQTIDTGDPVSLEGDVFTVTPRNGFAGQVSFHAETNGPNEFILIKTCNPTAAPIDPDGAGGTIYNWIVFDN